MTNTKIKDMIETIEQFAQSQPDFPVYNILGEVHTYGDLKADSDSLAAKIDSLDIPKNHLLWFMAVKSMKCWQLLSL